MCQATEPKFRVHGRVLWRGAQKGRIVGGPYEPGVKLYGGTEVAPSYSYVVVFEGGEGDGTPSNPLRSTSFSAALLPEEVLEPFSDGLIV